MAGDDIVDPAPEEDLKPSETIRNSVRLYFSIGLAAWIAFEFARKRLARAYYCRARSAETTTPIVEEAKRTGFWKWLMLLYRTSDDTIMAHCGLDTLFFLRFLRMCQKVAGAAVLMSAAIFPVYYYASGDPITTNSNLDHLYRMTLSHLDRNEPWRFWLTLGAIYIISAWTCYLLLQEYKEFVRRRHEFLSRKDTYQYSVVLNGLPKHLRTQQTLRNYLNVLFPNSVLHVYVALECGDLEKLVDERTKVRNNLENALATSAKTGERVLISTKLCCGEKVDAIELYQDQLRNLNDAVEMEVRAILRNQAALANQMTENSLDDIEPSFNTPTLGNKPVATLQQAQSSMSEETAYIRNLKRNKRGIKSTGIMRGTAFVTFNNLKAAQSAQQILQASDPTEMAIEAAPHIDDVVWENIGISYDQKSSWLLISYCLSGAVILFWTVPTIFVVNLAKLGALQESWPWLKRTLTSYPWLKPFFEQLSPVMLSVMNAVAPIILGILSKREGHASGARVEASLFNKMILYQVFIVFFLPMIGGSFADLTSKLQDVNGLIRTLSTVVPTQSTFYISFLIVQIGLNLSLELLRVTPIIKAYIYQAFAPKLTPRQRESAWFGLQPLDCPGDFGQTDTLAQYFLVLILILVFTPTAPLLCYFAGGYFVLSDLTYRWSVLCVNDPSTNAPGVYFPSLYRFCIGAVILAQVMMAILLGIKQVPLQAAIALALPFITVVFHLYVAAKYPRAARNLPLDECTVIDARRSRKLSDLEKILEDVYKQPAMAERAPIQPDYRVLGSNVDEHDQLASPAPEKKRLAPDQAC